MYEHELAQTNDIVDATAKAEGFKTFVGSALAAATELSKGSTHGCIIRFRSRFFRVYQEGASRALEEDEPCSGRVLCNESFDLTVHAVSKG